MTWWTELLMEGNMNFVEYMRCMQVDLKTVDIKKKYVEAEKRKETRKIIRRK